MKLNNIQDLYDYVINHIDDFKKYDHIGSGGQGKVYKLCDKNKLCIAVKKSYLDTDESKYLKTPYSSKALQEGHFIEMASSKLINQLILQKISPHFALSFTNYYKERDGICNDEYPYAGYHYIQYIDKSETWDKWVRKKHEIEYWYNAYFQIIYALYSIKKYFNMTHLDLHPENILVQKIKPGGYWEYIINDEHYYIPNLGFRIYILDFGHAWVPGIFQSWFIRERYKSKRVKRSFDLKQLFNITKSFSQSPKEFKDEIKMIIQKLKSESFSKVLLFFKNHYHENPNKKILDTFTIGKKLIITSIPKQLKRVVVKKF